MDRIVLYSTGCPRCRVLKKKLETKGLEYEEFTDADAMIEMGLKSVPVLSVDGNMMDFAAANQWINTYEGARDADRH